MEAALFVFLSGSGGSSSLVCHVNHPEESNDVTNEHTKHWWSEVEVEENWQSQESPIGHQNTFVQFEQIFCGLIRGFAFENSQEVKTESHKDGSKCESLNQEFQDSLKPDIRNNSSDELVKVMSERSSDEGSKGSVSKD